MDFCLQALRHKKLLSTLPLPLLSAHGFGHVSHILALLCISSNFGSSFRG